MSYINLDELDVNTAREKEITEVYFNTMQTLALLVDSNKLFAEVARAGGKTEGILRPRIINVAYSMPGEISFLCHSTYVALLTIVIPNIRASFNTPMNDGSGRLYMEEGKDYVVGEKKLPKHFLKPRYPITNPKHSIVYVNGHVNQLVATDLPDSIAGANGVHAFIEEMKHNRGDKLRSRVLPALRTNNRQAWQSPYYRGITGISDTARLDLGEDDWFTEYEKLVNKELIGEIITVALHVNKALYNIHNGKEIEKNQRTYDRWIKILYSMRRNATFFIRASSFVNKDILGFDFFQTMLETLSFDEFKSSILCIRPKRVEKMFFCRFDEKKHCFDDSYRYNIILSLDLGNTIKITSKYLKHYNANAPLLLGYDPGQFSSIVVAQESSLFGRKELKVLKEHFIYYPKSHADLAEQFNDFWGEARKNRTIMLYYDRAGNQTLNTKKQLKMDAERLRKELERYGWQVILMNKNQRTIFHYEHYALCERLFGEEENNTPRVRIDENECPNLKSAIYLSPVTQRNGYIELDKTSETKVPLQNQAGLTTQIPSALLYLLFGLYEKWLPDGVNNISYLPGSD
nr:hypothetical protein [uncultured Butyricimonas sp.]